MPIRIAIQGELGSNSHMAAVQMFAGEDVSVEIVACTVSAEVVARVLSLGVDGAVLPIENSLHGSVAEHYDLLLSQSVRIVRERSMRIRHNVIALPGVRLKEIRSVISHPVALSQCRRWQSAHPEILALPFYDTAGGVKHVVAEGLREMAAIAPALAAEVYGAEVLLEGVEDHAENYTRFHLIVRGDAEAMVDLKAADLTFADREFADREFTDREFADGGVADKMSVAFAVEHRPGTLVGALEGLARAGADLTKIESRPVPGRPWEYVFYVDLRFGDATVADAAVRSLRERCRMVKELGRYAAADRS